MKGKEAKVHTAIGYIFLADFSARGFPGKLGKIRWKNGLEFLLSSGSYTYIHVHTYTLYTHTRARISSSTRAAAIMPTSRLLASAASDFMHYYDNGTAAAMAAAAAAALYCLGRWFYFSSKIFFPSLPLSHFVYENSARI